jgi:hypothetical protein
LVKSKHLSVLKLILLAIFKNFTIFVHERPLHAFELFIKDDVLEGSHDVVKVDVLRGGGVIFIITDIPSAMI